MRELAIGSGRIELRLGDITTFQGDAIGNAANSALVGGGGVDGAIHRAGGRAILEECLRIGGCPTGQARATTAGRLAAKWVLHAVGPVYIDGEQGEPELLASAYRSILELADEREVTTLALPSISTGVYGYPMDEAAPIALGTVADHLKAGGGSLKLVTFYLYSQDTLSAYERAIESVARQVL